ncbi:hypothetical protein IJ596_04175 [bacterium]|nr:hypothetical protein [bacterium]
MSYGINPLVNAIEGRILVRYAHKGKLADHILGTEENIERKVQEIIKVSGEYSRNPLNKIISVFKLYWAQIQQRQELQQQMEKFIKEHAKL